MRQQIIIPWRDTGEPWRKKHFDFLCDFYSKEFDIVIGNNSGEFNRSAARNKGVLDSTSDISVIIDADNFIKPNQIWKSIELARSFDNMMVKPFLLFGYLTERSTNMFYNIFPNIENFRPKYIDPPQHDFTGGAYVMKKSLWLDLGGMDEGFVGWGAEDDAFHLLCKRQGLAVEYVDGYDYHLYHPAFRTTSEYNYKKLMEEYVHGN